VEEPTLENIPFPNIEILSVPSWVRRLGRCLLNRICPTPDNTGGSPALDRGMYDPTPYERFCTIGKEHGKIE
jgi:hypothetical protein